MLNLHGSRWAPASSRSQPQSIYPNTSTAPYQQSDSVNRHSKYTPAERQALTRQSEYNRFLRLLRRLKWKSHSLLFSHHRVLAQQTSTSINGVDWAMERGEAETMFRVDFFEWYVLLERCLVCLLAAVGVAVSAVYDPSNRSDRDEREGRVGAETTSTSAREEGPSLIGDGRMFTSTGGYGHRFHENVLAALDSQARNPLYEVLGRGRVREYIGVAKEFRNRWKDVDENTAGMGAEELEITMDRRLKRYEKILKDLNLDQMLGCILEALERARDVGEGEVRKVIGEAGGQVQLGSGIGEEIRELDMADAPFEAGVDAMEWD